MLQNTCKYLKIRKLHYIFVIENKTKKTKAMKEGARYYKIVKNDIKTYMRNDKVRDLGNNDLPPIGEYFLAIEKKPNLNAVDLLITYGGPTVYLRFFKNGTKKFVFHWGHEQYIKNITDEDWAKWLEDYFCLVIC